jgi:undecaprenyl-diphosphatase
LSSAALLLTFIGLFEWDAPLTKFVRSLNHSEIDPLYNPRLTQFSDVGDRLGGGESLVILSLAIMAVGFGLKQAVWKAAGWQSLIAHGLAGLVINLMKHLIGRPRPKFMHTGTLELSPITGSGWDSFPSGHAAASFAVATALAVRFPKVRWIFFAVAAAIAVSRVLRGSHFLTDIVAGAVIGYLAGSIAANPLREWRASLESAFLITPPFVAGLLVLVWTIGHHPLHVWPELQLMGAGMFVTVAGLVGHVILVVRREAPLGWLPKPLASSLIGFGFGMMTGSLLVMAAVLCACLAYWLRSRREMETGIAVPSGDKVWAKEALFATAVLLALLATIELRGVLPMR